MPDSSYELEALARGYNIICGCDETGIGSMCGDAYCCALILPNNIDYKKLMPGLNDSKKLSEDKRETLYGQIKACALDYAVGTSSVEEINEINIYWAKFRAFRRALSGLKLEPDFILIDGNRAIPEIKTPQIPIVKGDGKSISIAAASIIAKVERDRYVVELAKKVRPEYDWASNKGYYTQKHIQALKKYGKTEFHRDKYVEKFL